MDVETQHHINHTTIQIEYQNQSHHSAFDANGLLIKAAGKQIFYSGDFRGHGRKAWAFKELLSEGPKGVDALLMEGTTLGREKNEAPESETALENRLVHAIQCDHQHR